MFILDVLRYDIEQISSVVSLLNNDGCVGWRSVCGRTFGRQEVVAVMPDLVCDGLVDVYFYSSEQKCLVPHDPANEVPSDFAEIEDQYWYLLTEKGKELWADWEPPTFDSDTE